MLFQTKSRASLIGAILVFVTGCGKSPLDYVERGNKLLQDKKYDDAILQYRKALQVDPQFGEAYLRQGIAEMERNNGLAAFQPLARAVDLLPSSNEAKVNFANVSLALYTLSPARPTQLYEQIEKQADALLAKNPASFDGNRLKGSLRLLDRKAREAIVFFERANKAAPTRQDLVHIWVQALFLDNQIRAGEDMAHQVIEKDKSFGAIYEVLYQQYQSSGRASDAEAILKLRAVNNPQDGEARLQLARFYQQASQPAKMEDALQQALSLKDFHDARAKVGDFYGSIGKWPESERMYEEGARLLPEERIAYKKRLGGAYLTQKKRPEALAIAEEILKEEPKDESARHLRATFRLESGDPKQVADAVTDLQTLVREYPNKPEYEYLLGTAYLVQNNVESAWVSLNRYLSARPDDIPARIALGTIRLNERKPNDALRFAEEVLSRDPMNAAAQLLHLTAAIDSGAYNVAHSEVALLQRRYPQSVEVQLAQAMLAVAEKKYSEAETIFRKLGDKQTDGRADQGLVETFVLTNQYDRAVELIRERLKKTPGDRSLRMLLAATVSRSGNYELAATEYQAVAKSGAGGIEADLGLARALQLKGDTAGAIDILTKLSKTPPNNINAGMMLAGLWESVGLPQEALVQYQRLDKLRPNNPYIMNSVAFMLAETGGDLNEAMRLSQLALQQSPNNPALLDTLGWIYLRRGDKDSAVQTFASLVRQQPANPEFRYHYSMALLEKGDHQQAKEQVSAALKGDSAPELSKKIRALSDRLK